MENRNLVKMAGRIRTVKPEWLEDEIALLSDEARVLSVALLLMADDQGNGRGHDALLSSRVWPGKGDAAQRLARARRELASLRYVIFYTSEGQQYFNIRNFGRHQRIDRPSAGKVPPPSQKDLEDSEVARDSRGLDESSTNPQRALVDSRASLPPPDLDLSSESSLDPKSRSLDQPDRLGAKKRPRGRKQVEGTPFPEGWLPTDKHREMCATHGLDCEYHAQRFEAHHRSKGSTFKCWNAAFTTWLLRDIKWAKDHAEAEQKSAPLLVRLERDIKASPEEESDNVPY